MTPFSLADLGLSEDEIAGMDSLGALDTPPASTPELDEPAMTPFSLADLGLSEPRSPAWTAWARQTLRAKRRAG